MDSLLSVCQCIVCHCDHLPQVTPVKEGTGKERIEAYVRTKKCDLRWQGEEKIKHVKVNFEAMRGRVFGKLGAHEA